MERKDPTCFLESDEALDDMLRQFEAGTLDRAYWNHAAHIMVAGAYLHRMPLAEVISVLRRAIPHYNECHGVANTESAGYHETLTVFWAAIANEFLRDQTGDGTTATRVRQLVAAYAARRDVFREYWSTDIVTSHEARRRWVGPDLRPLDLPAELLESLL